MRAARERRTADVEPTRRASSRRPELPLYYRIYKTVEERIDRNHYGVGDRLPSEDDLCREFGVSRITIREAISRLVDEGLVVRRRGSGTFVAQHREKRAFKEITFTGELEDLFAQVEKAKVRSVHLSHEVAGDDIRDLMGLTDAARVTVIRRVRLFDEQPFAYTTNYLPWTLGRQIHASDLYQRPLLQLLETRLGVRFHHAAQTVEARVAGEEAAPALERSFGDPVLFVERLMYGAPTSPLSVVRSYYRADRYRLHMLLVRKGRGDSARQRCPPVPPSGHVADTRR